MILARLLFTLAHGRRANSLFDRVIHRSGDATCSDHALSDRVIHRSGDATGSDHALSDRVIHRSGDATCSDHALFDRVIHRSGDATCSDHALATRFRKARAGTVALEFALIGSTFLGLILFVFELGFLLYAQTALDYAVKEAARQMQTGQQSVASGSSQTSFQTVVLCPFLGTFLPCSGIVVTLQPVTTFQAASTPPAPPYTNLTVDPGVSGNLMLLQAYYTPNILIWPLNVTRLVGTAAYLNE